MADFNLLRFGALLFVLVSMQSAKADYINLTGAEISPNIAEIFILDDHIKVKLEVFVGNLETFEELIPDDWVANLDIERPTQEQRARKFANQKLKIVTGNGEILAAQIMLVEPRVRVDRRSPYAGKINPYNLQQLPDAPADNRVVYAEIIYPFDKKPDRLTFIPPLNEEGTASVDIGFIAYHQAVPIIDFRFLGRPETLNLDWQDPWYSSFENKVLTRHHRYPIMLFLYVEPRQVRLETIMRVADITKLTGFDNDNELTNPADRLEQLQQHVSDYLARQNPLEIDGNFPKPDAVRAEILSIGLTGVKLVENLATVDESSLLIGTSQRFFVSGLPEKVDTQWQFFNPRVDRIPVTATDPVGPLSSFITTDAPAFGWKNFLKQYQDPELQAVSVDTGWNIDLPFIGKVNVFDQLPDQQQAFGIVSGVLENVRVSFVEQDPASFSRVLGEAVRTPDLDAVKTELAKLYAPQVSGGTQGAVQSFFDLKIINLSEQESANGFAATVNGSAIISAQHWGHVDKRRINFQLLLDLVEEDDRWYLTDLTVIDLKEVK